MIENIFSFFIATLSAIFVAYFSYKFFQKKVKIFKGRLDDKDSKSKFIDFIYKKEDEIFGFDINLDDGLAEEFKRDFQISFFEYDENDILDWGVNIQFCKNDKNIIFTDMRDSSQRLKGYFKVIHASGPQQGWMTIVIKHVEIEAIYNNLEMKFFK